MQKRSSKFQTTPKSPSRGFSLRLRKTSSEFRRLTRTAREETLRAVTQSSKPCDWELAFADRQPMNEDFRTSSTHTNLKWCVFYTILGIVLVIFAVGRSFSGIRL